MARTILPQSSWIAHDFVPETFGRLTTESDSYKPPGFRHVVQDFICECGQKTTKVRAYVTSGNTRSCGCLKKDRCGPRTHSRTGTPEHKAWKALNARCNKVNSKGYKDYGARGIRVCDEWREPKGRGFLNFLEHIGEKPVSGVRLTVDRKDVNKNYEPGNVRWATDEEQANNTRRTRRYTAFGKSQTAREWSNETGLTVYAIKARMKTMPPAIALTVPIGQVPAKAKLYTLGGRTQSLPHWCRELGVVEETARGKLARGLSIEQALATEPYVHPKAVYIEAFGERLTIAQWSRKTGLSVPTIYGRVSLGYSPEATLTLPPRTRRKKIT